MSGKVTFYSVSICWLLASLAHAADGPASFDREDVAKYAPTITLQLRSGSSLGIQKAVETIRNIASNSPRGLSDNLPQWLEPMLQANRFDDVLDFSAIAIIDRGFDVSTVEKLQEARVQALVGQGRLDRALSEAKSLYNVCVLKNTPHAVDLMCSILDRQGKSVAASRLRIEQTYSSPSKPTPQTASDNGFDNGLPVTGARNSIVVDASPWQQAIDGLAAGHTFNDFMKRANLALLADKPDLARKSFESACQMVDGASKKNVREAIEGIARCIRDAPEGTPALANNFITNLRRTPEIAGVGLSQSISTADLRSAAQVTTLAQLQTVSIPPMEEERAKSESSVAAGDGIKILTDFECATPVQVKKLSATHFELSFIDPGGAGLRNWLMVRVEGAAGRLIRVDIKDPYGSLDKWLSFNPVYSYEKDLSNLATYTASEVRDGAPQRAWNGALLPSTAGQKWHYIPNVWQVDVNTVGFTVKFEEDSAYLAMRAPYTPTYNERYLKSISNPAAQLIQIGNSREGRPLMMLKIGTGDEKAKPCVLIYAREHADEHDTSWVAQGMIESLLNGPGDVRSSYQKTTFLIIPIFDPDAASASTHENILRGFDVRAKCQESIAYATWIKSWIDSGRRLDVVLDLHNVQSRESQHVVCSILDGKSDRKPILTQLNMQIITTYQNAGFNAPLQPWRSDVLHELFGYWLADCYGCATLLYEFNSQDAERHLDLIETRKMGSFLATSVSAFLTDPSNKAVLARIDGIRKSHDSWHSSRKSQTVEDPITYETEWVKTQE